MPTSLHAIDRAEIQIGDTVLVLGSGPVGLSSIIFAKMSGATKVLCIGAPGGRLDIARRVGADDVMDFEIHSMDDRLDWVRGHTEGRGADATARLSGLKSLTAASIPCQDR